jgi:hypothetical protein
MKKTVLIGIGIAALTVSLFFMLSCGSDPEMSEGDIKLNLLNGVPYVYIEPTEHPDGDPTFVRISQEEFGDGTIKSYVEKVVYDNTYFRREVSAIRYYSYYGLLQSYAEDRSFEDGSIKHIDVTDCTYNYSGHIRNYTATIDRVTYYYAGDYDPDTAQLGGDPTGN